MLYFFKGTTGAVKDKQSNFTLRSHNRPSSRFTPCYGLAHVVGVFFHTNKKAFEFIIPHQHFI